MDKLQDLIDRRNAIVHNGSVRENGRLSARERMNRLFDEGSFIETDIFSGKDGDAAAEGVITGYGTVDARLVFAYAQDGAAFGIEQAKKINKLMDMALKTGAPCVALLDSVGAKLSDGLTALSAMGGIYTRAVKASGAILQIAAIFGSCAGGEAYIPALADFLVMTKKSYMMLNGPALCASEGSPVTADDIGSADINAAKSGSAHFVAEDDAAAIETIKGLLSYLPGNCEEEAPAISCTDDLNRLSDQLGRAEADAHDILSQIVDNGTYTEISALFAPTVVTALARINGRTAAFVANNGEMTLASADKAARFIRFADRFHLPVVTLCNVAGFSPSVEDELGGLVRHAANLAAAYSEASVPKVTVVTGRSCTSASLAMGSRAVGADFVVAWPEAVIGALTPEMASVLLYGEAIAASADPIAERKKAAAYYADEAASAIAAAQTGFIDDVIEPDSTRPRLAAALEMLYGKCEELPVKKYASTTL